MFQIIEEDFGDISAQEYDPYRACLVVNLIFFADTEYRVDLVSDDDLRIYENTIMAVGVMRALIGKKRIPISVGMSRGSYFQSYQERISPLLISDEARRANGEAMDIVRDEYHRARAVI